MSIPIVFRRGVERDLAGASGWYDQQRPGLGEEFLLAVRASFELIQRYPELYAPVHGEVRRAIVSRFPYAVFYKVEAKRVVVLTVLHTARNPRLWPRATRKPR